MSKKEEKNENKGFDIETALNKLEYPEWVVRAFAKQTDLSKIKNDKDLEKEFKKYMER